MSHADRRGRRDFWAELSGKVLAHLLMGYMERHPERAAPHAAFLGRGVAAADIERHAEAYTAQLFAAPEARALDRFLIQDAEAISLARAAARGPAAVVAWLEAAAPRADAWVNAGR